MPKVGELFLRDGAHAVGTPATSPQADRLSRLTPGGTGCPPCHERLPTAGEAVCYKILCSTSRHALVQSKELRLDCATMNMTGPDQRFGGSTSVSAIMRWLLDWIEMV
jgi:transposase